MPPTPMPSVLTAFRTHMLPSLVAIYAPHARVPHRVIQVGTGFLVSHQERPVLVTAAHVLYGASFTEKSGDKSFFVNGALTSVASAPRNIVYDQKFDAAVFFVDEFARRPLLPTSSITWPAQLPRLSTAGGYLSKSFKRSGGGLRPAPMIHTDITIAAPAVPNGHFAIRYTKRRNINSLTGLRLQSSPIPRGLSGGPMVDTASLIKGQPNVLGALAELQNGLATGPNSLVIQALLNAL